MVGKGVISWIGIQVRWINHARGTRFNTLGLTSCLASGEEVEVPDADDCCGTPAVADDEVAAAWGVEDDDPLRVIESGARGPSVVAVRMRDVVGSVGEPGTRCFLRT
jgi:hypothetical protein